MASPKAQFIEVGHGADCRRIATIVENRGDRAGPGVIWLPGFKSEMTSTKVTALAEWAAARGVSMTRLDYSGHGQSPGRVEDGTIGRWLEEVRAVFVSLTSGRQVVVGSSMGGYLALLLLRQLMREAPEHAARIQALVLIAPAWDMTERIRAGLSDEAKRDIEQNGVWYRPSRYGDDPYPITRQMLDEGKRHLIGSGPFDPGRPIHILHGRQDPDVPWEHSVALVKHLGGGSARLITVPDGDHRLSRPEDLELLLKCVGDVD